MKTIILGAGFSGLAAGIKTGADIYEGTNVAGGICRDYVKDGFTFSNGGPHFIFGTGPGLDYIKTLVEVKEYERKAGVYYNTIFPYPVQTTIKQNTVATPGSMKFSMGQKFGKEACNIFFDPFNEKYTAGLYDSVIQYDEYKSPPPGGKGFATTFGDPVGGLSALVDQMASKCKIHYNKKAVKVNTEAKSVLFEDNEVIWYDRLISTIPLGQMLRMCGRQDFRLPYTSVLVLNIGADRAPCTPKEHWLYIPFCKSGFHRIAFYTNVDHTKAPEGKVGLSVEIGLYGVDYEELDLDYIIYHVVNELQSWRFIGNVITVDPSFVKTAYTWLHDKDDANKEIAWLKERDIISTGRFGKHKFQGLVDSIKDGFEVDEK